MSSEKTTHFGYYVDLLSLDIDIYEDKWLPYTEGHYDCEFDLVYSQCGGGEDILYFGYTFAKSGQYDGQTNDVVDLEDEKPKYMRYEIIKELLDKYLVTEEECENLPLCQFVLVDTYN